MDHRALIASLTPEQRRSLTARSNAAGLLRLAVHWGSIVAIGALIVLRVPFWPALVPVQGILIVFQFTLLHEAIHRTPFASRWLNDGAARVCGFLIGLAPGWFRDFHFAHHRHTQDPERDPELATAKPATMGAYLAYMSGLPTWRDHAITLFRNAAGRCADPFVPAGRRKTVQREAQGMLAAYGLVFGGAIAFGLADILLVWIGPVLVGQPFLRLYLLAEHGRCPQVANMLENTRTVFTNGLVRFLAWNMPYHAEHHAFPSVPFHKLPEFHALTRQHLRATERGYARFNRNYASRFVSNADGRSASL